MNDKKIYAALIKVLDEALKAHGHNDIRVLRGDLNASQKRPNEPTITLVKLFDRHIGQPFKTNVFDAEINAFRHKEITLVESTFQITAFFTENPADVDGPTASDLCNLAAHILSHDDALVALGNIGLRPVNFTSIRNNQSENEKGGYELTPSFDLVITHRFISENVTPAAQTLEGKFA